MEVHGSEFGAGLGSIIIVIVINYNWAIFSVIEGVIVQGCNWL